MGIDNTPVGIIFTIVPIFIGIIFIALFGIIIFSIVKNISTWSHNNSQPKLTVVAKIVSKRQHIATHMHNDADNFSHSDTSTSYFVTFEVESGDRMEFRVNGSEYGILAEQDKGNLNFQGTRYLGFQRIS